MNHNSDITAAKAGSQQQQKQTWRVYNALVVDKDLASSDERLVSHFSFEWKIFGALFFTIYSASL